MDNVLDVSLASVPQLLWKYYLDYLWYYEPNSWVARTAHGARLLAVLVALPIVILALLDIASYGIARTLGVIDDVKASTSDVASVHVSNGIHESGNPNNNNNNNNNTLSHRDSISAPIRSDEELLYSPLPAAVVPEISTAESSASEEVAEHALHNFKTSNSSQSLLSIPSVSTARARSDHDAWGSASNSDGILHQRQAKRVENDP